MKYKLKVFYSINKLADWFDSIKAGLFFFIVRAI